MFEDSEPLPVSALNQLLYCERRCALIHIEGVFAENAYTLEGRLAHDAADTPGYETAAGCRVVRALPLFSRKHNLSGRADIVEFRRQARGIDQPYPIDYKRGKKSKWTNDDVQLCAQALCLEEMLGLEVPAGAIFHARSRRRREVPFTAGLREITTAAIERLHELIQRGVVPEAQLMPKCEGCSLHEICLPELSGHNRCWSAERRTLFSGE
ncbi:MAG TPA: CRISPR-associated protein Cas4 [Bryobacteraceae bacterium]|nr:CRISPR-associated protein Cas4 [Bryobacteraceae bacterium]